MVLTMHGVDSAWSWQCTDHLHLAVQSSNDVKCFYLSTVSFWLHYIGFMLGLTLDFTTITGLKLDIYVINIITLHSTKH